MKKILALAICLFLNSNMALFSQIIDDAAEKAVQDHYLLVDAEDVLAKLKAEYSNKSLARDYARIYKTLFDYVSRLKLKAHSPGAQKDIQDILNQFPAYK